MTTDISTTKYRGKFQEWILPDKENGMGLKNPIGPFDVEVLRVTTRAGNYRWEAVLLPARSKLGGISYKTAAEAMDNIRPMFGRIVKDFEPLD